MAAIQQDVLGVLLRTLASNDYIGESTYEKAVKTVRSRLDFPEFFEYSVCCRKEEDVNGCTQD